MANCYTLSILYTIEFKVGLSIVIKKEPTKTRFLGFYSLESIAG
jgi:hypothetical protein